MRDPARRRDGDELAARRGKAWITHGGQADFYTVIARTGEGSRGISCFLVPADTPGLTAGRAGAEDGPDRVRPRSMHLDGVEIEADRLIGAEGRGWRSRWPRWTPAGSGSPRCATGLAQAALDHAVGVCEASARPSASRSSITRASASCSPTWRPAVQSARAT